MGRHRIQGWRFAAVVAHAFVNADDARDVDAATSYIRVLNELNEDDIRVLYCYQHQKGFVLENHAMASDYYFGTAGPRRWFEGIGSLGMQVEDFYSHCLRFKWIWVGFTI